MVMSPASYRVGRDRGGCCARRLGLYTVLSLRHFQLTDGVLYPLVRGRRRLGRGASRPARAAWLVQRLLTADGDVAGELPGRSRSRWLLRTATRALHRALSPTFPAGRWCSLSLGEGASKTRARRIKANKAI